MTLRADNILDRIGIAEAYKRCTGYEAALFPKCGKNQHLVHCPSIDHPLKQGAIRDAHPSCALDLNKNVAKCFSCGYKSGILGLIIASGHATDRVGAIAWLRSNARIPALPMLPMPTQKRGYSLPLRNEIEVARYDYHDINGRLRYRVIRKEGFADDGTRGKRFLQVRPYYGEATASYRESAQILGWIYHLGATCDPRQHPQCLCHDPDKPAARQAVEPLLYRLSDVERARKESRVLYCVEGEKCAEALAQLGKLATSLSGGAQTRLGPSQLQLLTGIQTLVMLPDADVPGRRAAEENGKRLLGRADRVILADLFPDRRDGYDIANWVATERAAHISPITIADRFDLLVWLHAQIL